LVVLTYSVHDDLLFLEVPRGTAGLKGLRFE
jgi:hypothetical protein